MDPWQIDDYHRDEDTGRILSMTSGNAQSVSGNHKLDSLFADTPAQYVSSSSTRRGYGERKYLAPPATLASSEGHETTRRKDAFRRLRRRFELSTKYQQRPEYQKYRARARKDTDKGGMIIWTDEMEEAFSNALVNIPPMGRRKRSQHGKSYGRNELIREWMLQETGVLRKRKQISSHIQVLDNIFKNFPDWKRLTKIPTANTAPEPELYDYYNDSVANMVHNWPALKSFLQNSSVAEQNVLPMPPMLRSTDPLTWRHPLDRIEFEMWIGPASNVDKCLHRYTKAVSNHSSFGKMNYPLESIQDWRHRYPDLETTIEDLSTTNTCDIISLDACLQMMTDFPLEQVKLGINLQLEFRDEDCHNSYEFGYLESFSCITRMYRNGKFLRQTEMEHCQVTGHGKMKPPFESKWWAQEFVRLTDVYRVAEESGNEVKIAAAAETTKNFFQGLTIMQQIFTNQGTDCLREMPRGFGRQPVAILLWSFTHAQFGQPAITVPRKMIVPPNRITTNSPLPPNDTMLPPFTMDTTLHKAADDAVNTNLNSLPALDPNPLSEYSSDMEELCQDGFMILAQQRELKESLKSCNPLMTHQESGTNNGSMNGLEHVGGRHLLQTSLPDIMRFSETHEGNLDRGDNHHGHLQYYHRHTVPHPANGTSTGLQLEHPRSPLENFDVSTHDRLQGQLAQHIRQEEILRSQLIPPTDSLICDLQRGESVAPEARQGVDSPHMIQVAPTAANTTHNAAPLDDRILLQSNDVWHSFDLGASQVNGMGLLPRPSLQQHHSFAGILPMDEDTFETPRKTFTRLLEQMEMDPNGVIVQHEGSPKIGSGDIARSQSQPPPDIHLDFDGIFMPDESSMNASRR